MENQQATDYQAAYNAGQKQVQSLTVGDVPLLVIPQDMKVEALEKYAEQLRPRPLTLEQTVKTLSAPSFLDYYNRYADEHSTIFVDTETGRFEAILDYHASPTEPAHKRHRVVYNCPQSKEWSAWIKNNNEKMTQEEFALFIEDNLLEIEEPNGAQMLEIASTLKATNSVNFRQSTRIDNGQVQFTYQETIDGQAGHSGQFEIPEQIGLILRPFHGGASYRLRARFRYRITPSGLVLWYTLVRPHLVKEDAIKDVLEMIADEMGQGQLIEADNF